MTSSSINTTLIHDLFVRTADENYITARWCFSNRLRTDFAWLSVHALEKYMKSVLLMNGKSSKNHGHKIAHLYKLIKPIAGSLLPTILLKPPTLEIDGWRDQTPEEFLKHIYLQGNPDSRYLIFGHIIHNQDLYMVDHMVFSIRRLICALDERIFRGNSLDLPKLTSRDYLAQDPMHYHNLQMPLDKLIHEKVKTPLRSAALNLNLPFAPTSFKHMPMRTGTGAHNPAIIRRILDPLKSDDPVRAAEGLKIGQWFIKHIQLSRPDPELPDVLAEITAAMTAARRKHGLP